MALLLFPNFKKKALEILRKLSRVRHFLPSRIHATADEDSFVELEITGVGEKHRPSPLPLNADSDARRSQRNSKKRNAQVEKTLAAANDSFLRAYKYKRHDVHFGDWPRIDISWLLASPTATGHLYSIDAVEPMLDEGFDSAYAVSFQPGKDSIATSWTPGSTVYFVRVGTFRLRGLDSVGVMASQNSRWNVQMIGVCSPPRGGGRPWGFHSEMMISESGKVIDKGPSGVQIYDVNDQDSAFGWIKMAAANQGRRLIDWDVNLTRGSFSAFLPVDRVGVREMLFDRDNDGFRRSAALHWVNTFSRKDGTIVPAHMRGKTQFRWKGFDVDVCRSSADDVHAEKRTMPEFDHHKYSRTIRAARATAPAEGESE